MEDALMSGIPEALTIWLALLGASLAAFGILALVAGRARRGARAAEATEATAATATEGAAGPVAVSAAGRPPARGPRLAVTRLALAIAKEPPPEPTTARPAYEAEDALRFAGEIAIAAGRAAVTADRRQSEWMSAQRAVDAAWQAYEAADRAARRSIRAAAFPTPATPLTPAEYADRERHLHRAARAAHARGELSTDQFIDAMSHRNGFDPTLHPFEQDATLRRIVRDRLLQVYLTASDLERTAWREADLAMAAKQSLDREATDAARKIQHTHRLATRVPVRTAEPQFALR